MILGKKVTISDIARLSDLSEATISRVLNNKPNVSPATRQIVLDAIETLGYVHTPRTRSEDHQLKNVVLCMGLFDTSVNLTDNRFGKSWLASQFETSPIKFDPEN